MAIHNEAEKIKSRLAGIPGVASTTRGWPRADAMLPCIAVTKAADTPTEFRDDREYLAELEYYIRIFTERASVADRIAEDVDAAMEDMGYLRTFSYDDDTGEVRIAAMRYRKFV